MGSDEDGVDEMERRAAENDQVSAEWRAALTTLVDRKLQVAEHLPDTLYHYTSVQGFHAIVGSSTLHATHVNHMADAAEVGYGRKLLQDTIVRLTKSWPSEASKTLVEQVLYSASAADGMLPGVYATCLSRLGDDVGQWERYADHGRGYAIGFASEELRIMQRPDPTPAGEQGYVDLDRVIYDADTQQALLDRLVGKAVELLDAAASYEVDRVSALGHALSVPAMRLIVSFKQPGFRGEDEWRLVYNKPRVHDPFMSCSFKPGSRGLTPYVELQYLRADVQQSLPITSVTTGPRQDKQTAPVSTMSFLAQPRADPHALRYPIMAAAFRKMLSGDLRDRMAKGKVVVGSSDLTLR